MTPTTAPVPAAPEPMHGCVRCGARIPIAESMCERCNPLGLKAPAASQAHGTVLLAIAGAVVLLAVAARVAVSGIGPFTTQVADVTADPAGLRVTIALTNTGSSSGGTTCKIADPLKRGIGPETAYVTSPQVPAGGTVSFEAVVTTMGTEPRPLSVECGR